MQEGPFNDILNWRYCRLPDVLGKGRGFCVETEEQLEIALAGAAENEKSFSIIEVRLDPMDRSPALHRLASRLAKRV
jgi:indolepyruvate decarboxylase